MSYSDRKFYASLFWKIFGLLVLFRILVSYSGIKVHIPILDPIILFIFNQVSLLARSLGKILGSWG